MVVKSHRMKIIKLSATWCGPCKVYAPKFNKWAEENPDIESISMDVDTHIIDKAWDIKNVPTTILVDEDMKLIDKRVGMLTDEQLTSFVAEHPE